MMMKDDEDNDQPLADDFSNYLPWACTVLGVPAIVEVTDNAQATTEKIKKTKSRSKLSTSGLNMSSNQEEDSFRNIPQPTPFKQIINVTATYSNNNLVEISFERNRKIPRLILKIIRLIIPFHYYVNKIYIDGGFDKYTIHEIIGIMNVSNITEICLDKSFVSEGNYSILLEGKNNLRHLSVTKCRINDEVVEEMCKNLVHPKESAKTLVVLNLSSNMITDAGAKCIAEMLRSNRKIGYLNLADNKIEDVGAGAILDTLMEFPLRDEELTASKSRHIVYLKYKNEVIKRMLTEVVISDAAKKASKKKLRSSSVVSLKKGKQPKLQPKSVEESKVSLTGTDIMYEKVEKMAEENLGGFNDPFDSSNTFARGDKPYCKGNNALFYLNFAYNNLTYFSLKKTLDVLVYQKLLDRKPIGLVSVSLDGNYLPVSCKELDDLDDMISHKAGPTKKRQTTKTGNR